MATPGSIICKLEAPFAWWITIGWSRAFSRVAKGGRVFARLPVLQEIAGSPEHLTRDSTWKLDGENYPPQVVDDLKVKMHDDQIYTMEELTSMISINNVGMLRDFIGVVIGVAVVVGFIVVFAGDAIRRCWSGRAR